MSGTDPVTAGAAGAGTGAGMGPWGALAGFTLGAGGSLLAGAGAKREARRKRAAIQQAMREREGVTNRVISANSQAGAVRQGALLRSLLQRTDPSAATADAGARSAAIASRVAGATAGTPAPADPVVAAALARSTGQQATQRRAADSLALLRALELADRRAGQTAQTTALGAEVPLQETLYRSNQELNDIEARLQSVLGTTGNSTNNLQLLAGLLNAGAAGSWGLAERA